MLHDLISKLMDYPEIHARWLNTLSMMENVGAKKIKKCEDPVFVNETILKHASEEARHAYYLKRQINKLKPGSCPTYEEQYLLAAWSSYAYLNQLDVDVCRYLKKVKKIKAAQLKYAAYLLVTYAIEVRADELYPIYQQLLKQRNSTVSVRNIIAEEQNHLETMQQQLQICFDDWQQVCKDVCMLEEKLHQQWLKQIHCELFPLEPQTEL